MSLSFPTLGSFEGSSSSSRRFPNVSSRYNSCVLLLLLLPFAQCSYEKWDHQEEEDGASNLRMDHQFQYGQMADAMGRHHPSNWFHLLKRSFPPPPSSSASILTQKWQCSPADLLRSASVQMALAELLTGTLDQQAIPAGQQFVAANSKRRKRGGGAEGTSMAAEGFFEDAAEECAAAVEDETQKEGGGRGEEEEIAPGMPLELRSVCPFVYVDNVNEMRLPRRITEVKCVCELPRRRPSLATEETGIRCEPLQVDIPVLLFETGREGDDTSSRCSQFRRAKQRITMGCVAVQKTASRSEFISQIGQAQQPKKTMNL